jgi:hypothetical protein
MGNRPRETTGANEPKRQHQVRSSADDASKQAPRDTRQSQDQGRSDDDRSDPDRVEIGDPVPEDDRTIRSRGGETGEDEDLPGDARGGETGEDEGLPDDGAGIESARERH